MFRYHLLSSRPLWRTLGPLTAFTVPKPLIIPISVGHVNAPDADIIFKSSDDVLFHVHRKNLEVASAGFPFGGFTPAHKEPIELPETADVLELLFQFVYPRKQPSLTEINFRSSLKWQRWQRSTKVQYWDLVDRAAPSTIKVSHNVIGELIDPKIAPTWLKYNQQWNEVINGSHGISYSHWNISQGFCPHFIKVIQRLDLGEPVEDRIRRELYSTAGSHSSGCNPNCGGMTNISKFSWILRGIERITAELRVVILKKRVSVKWANNEYTRVC
ncbi:hypothetical protein BDZ94DRAFT_1238025 [Collybia nuda]|uniref:BTB domain-containing protein n=1 Tax=Collybia nuda TaxID=64659 RepID=A0A9P5Y4A3_9AGAR|nr:hypothetical protein BDZ94DRAFT_1238025 [Collybia nuda]